MMFAEILNCGVRRFRLGLAICATLFAFPAQATDLIVSGIEGVEVWMQAADGRFSKTTQDLAIGKHNAGGALGDFNGDGKLDWFGAALTQRPHQVWFGAGKGKFESSAQQIGGERSSWGVTLSDVDRDRDLDVLVSSSFGAGTCQPSELWRNDGAGRFELAQLIGKDCSISATFADVDADADPDLITATTSFQDDYAKGPGANKVWLNDGTGRFSDSGQLLSIGSASYGVAAADLDHDGDVDLVFANGGPNTVWFNDGQGNFTEATQRLGTHRAYAVALHDLDGDRDIDAFFAASDYQGSRVWLNDGKGGFKDSELALGKGSALDVVVADIDGDGDADAILANRNLQDHDTPGTVQIWLNDGHAHFALSPQKFAAGHYRKVAVGRLGR